MACFNCNVAEPYDEEFETVCSDCCVIMCNACKYDDDNLCGCYGNCDLCDSSVDRGSDGRKCMDCQQWLCNDCKIKSGCRRCGGYDSSYSSDSSIYDANNPPYDKEDDVDADNADVDADNEDVDNADADNADADADKADNADANADADNADADNTNDEKNNDDNKSI